MKAHIFLTSHRLLLRLLQEGVRKQGPKSCMPKLRVSAKPKATCAKVKLVGPFTELPPGRLGPFTELPPGRPRFLLGIFSGSGNLSKAARGHGWQTREVDILNGQDLTDVGLQDELLALVSAGGVAWVHMGPPCTTFSSWYLCSSHSNTRSKENPEGFGNSKDEVLGNTMAYFSVKMANKCIRTNTWFTIEQPRSSWMWLLKSMRALALNPTVHFTYLTMCSYGSPYQKRTAFLSNARFTTGVASSCNCKRLGKEHVRLQGAIVNKDGTREHRTKIAAAYPPSLCEALVACASQG